MSNYKFETLQIHVGQENPDFATDARALGFLNPFSSLNKEPCKCQ